VQRTKQKFVTCPLLYTRSEYHSDYFKGTTMIQRNSKLLLVLQIGPLLLVCGGIFIGFILAVSDQIDLAFYFVAASLVVLGCSWGLSPLLVFINSYPHHAPDIQWLRGEKILWVVGREALAGFYFSLALILINSSGIFPIMFVHHTLQLSRGIWIGLVTSGISIGLSCLARLGRWVFKMKRISSSEESGM
jgi:hypothetical protein